MVIDNPSAPSSSRVAAGIYNPVTGRKMVKSWNADKLFPFLHHYYPDLEEETGARFFYPKTIYRPFLSVEEQNEWMAKSSYPEYTDFIEAPYTTSFSAAIHDPYGGLALKQCGYVDIPRLLSAFRQTLVAHRAYTASDFDEKKLKIKHSGVQYENLTAGKLIFCDGYSGTRNKYFDWLPFKPVKGEILTIRTAEEFDVIFNRGVFILPLGGGICRVGATYEWKDLSPTLTTKGKNMLVEKLNALFKCSYSITGQQTGVRPATKDRRPYIGVHPEHKPLVIFNGLGAKGVSLAPYYAARLIDFLESGRQLEEEVNISRHFSLYYNQK